MMSVGGKRLYSVIKYHCRDDDTEVGGDRPGKERDFGDIIMQDQGWVMKIIRSRC